MTVLGVIIGTASIVVMVSLGIGLKELNMELIESYGSLTSINVRADRYYGEDSKTEPNYLTDDVVAQLGRLEHVTSVYPMLEISVLMRQGAYESGMQLTGVPREYLEQIPLGQGELPDEGSKDLELIFGNAVIQWFPTPGPDGDIGKPGNCRILTIWENRCLWFCNGQILSVAGGRTVKAPKKYLLKTAGVDGRPA